MGAESIRNALGTVLVPEHRHSGWYHAGGLTFFFLLLQAVSGALLAIHYHPSAESAYASVSRIGVEVPLGWFVRAIHRWSSHLLMLSAALHFGSKLYFRSYRQSHGSTWRSGLLLMSILLAFAFTGHLLPWDATGYFATRIGVGIASSAPFIGGWLADFLSGGPGAEDNDILPRIFALHAIVLPLLTFFVLSFHLLRTLLDGWSVPEGVRVDRRPRLYPEFLLRTAKIWVSASMLLLTLAVFFPGSTGQPADSGTAAPPGIRPEWYFLPLYQTIRMLPGTIGGLGTETVLITILAIGAGVLYALPSIDRGRGTIVRGLALMTALYVIATIIIAWMGL